MTTGARPGAAAAPRRARRPRSRATRPPTPATPSRSGSTPRTPTATSPRRPGAIAPLRLPGGPGLRVDTGVAEGDAIPPRLRLDDRQDHRLRPRPRRGARPAAPRPARDRGRHRGRHHNKSFLLDLLDAARGRRGDASTPAGSTGRGDGPRSARGRHAGSRLLRGRDRGLRDGARRSSAISFFACGRARPPAGAARLGRAVELRLRGHGVQGSVVRKLGPQRATGATSTATAIARHALERGGAATRAPARTVGGDSLRPPLLGALVAQALDHLVEVDGVAAPRARDEGGVCAPPRPRSSCRSRARPGDEVAGGRTACSSSRR